MKKNLLKKTIAILIFIFVIFLLNGKVKAATISISPSKTSVSPGEQVTITISSDCTGRINIGTTGGTLSSSSVWVEGNSQTVTLTTKSAGTITVTAQPVTLSSSSGEEVSVGSKSCNIKVVTNSPSGNTSNNNNSQTNNDSNSKSSVATLSNLGITPNDFKGFSPSKTSYSVTVPNSVSSISVYASKGQSGQTISGIGAKSLKEGTNQFNVTVTAEDGKTTKTYSVNVTREKSSEEKDKTDDDKEMKDDKKQENENQEDTKNEIGLSKLKIDGVNLQPNFQKDIYEYSIELKELTTSLDIDFEPLSETQKVEIIGNQDLKKGENIITILVSDKDGANTATYQLTVNENLDEAIEALSEPEIEKDKDEIEGRGKSIIIITILVIVITIIAVILIIRYVRYRREEYDNGYFDQDNDIFDDIKKENNQLEEFTEDSYDDKPKKKSKSKGKRFK